MNLTAMIERMRRFPRSLSVLVETIPPEDARQRGPGGEWSILEIVCHLTDEEEADFRQRIRLMFENPTLEWPPNDPEAWATERRYNQRDLRTELERFAAARSESVLWLHSLESPDWSAFREHPRAGRLRAGDLMVSWCAHDALHLRQVARRLYELAARDAPGFSADYAGAWG